MNDKQRDETVRYIVDQAAQAAATAHYAVLALKSVLSHEAIPEGISKDDPAAIFRHLRERHKPVKESSFYVKPDGSIGCHRDNHHKAKAERQALRAAVAKNKGEEYRSPATRDKAEEAHLKGMEAYASGGMDAYNESQNNGTLTEPNRCGHHCLNNPFRDCC